MKDLDILVVATLARSDEIKSYDPPANALIASFVPFDEIFKHVDLIVTNGGYCTVQQALSAGVPLVLAGMPEDKPEVNTHVTWTGAGVNLATQRPEPSQEYGKRWRKSSVARLTGRKLRN